MTIARLLLLIAAFQIEVRVRASAVDEALWRPAGCESRAGDCVVQAGSARLGLGPTAARIDAAPGATLERKTTDWKLLTGVVRSRGAAVHTIYGELRAGDDREAWILAEDADRVTVRAVRGSAEFRGRDGAVLEIPEGFEIWVGALDRGGETLHGVPAEIPVADHLRRWAGMDRLTKEALKAQAAELRVLWRDRQLTGSALYDEVAKRRLAGEAEAERLEAARRKAVRDRRAEDRRLLFRTAFEK